MNQDQNHVSLKWFGLPRLLPWLKPHKMLFFWMISLGLYGGAIDFVLPLFQQYAINNFVAKGVLDGLWVFIGVYLLVLITQTAANCVSAYYACKVEMYVGRDLKRESFNHLQTLSFSYFNRNSVGYIHARVMSDTDRIAAVLSWSVIEAVWYVTYLIGAIVMMLILNWKLALCVLLVVPLLAVAGMYFQKKLGKKPALHRDSC